MEPLEEAERLFFDALARHQKGELESAQALYQQALALVPGRASVMNNLATVYLGQKQPLEAKRLCESVLEQDPGDEVALVNLGNCQVALNQPQAALLSYEKALATRPDYAEALYGRANILRRSGQLDAALASYDRVLAAVPGHLGALNNRCIVLEELDRREALIDAYQRLLAVAPDHPYMRGYLLHAELRCCQWLDYDARVARVIGDARAGKRADSPFHFLVISDSPADQLRCARTCIADEYPAAAQPVWRGERYGHERIRVAYVSADFCGHAVSYLHAGLMEAHDRSRFDITAVSLGPERNDEMQTRLKAAFDRFIDVRDRSDLEVARLLYELEVDIAVDLQGFTSGCRMGIFAHRGAPVQVNWLGYPGTAGADYIHYIIGDGTVTPREHHVHYTERIITLPDCYQPNDARRRIAGRVPTRAELGLPGRGFVFCCFNNNHKITPRVFDMWMRLLKGAEGSVLWLLRDHEMAEHALRREAERKGVAPARLIFAPRVSMDEHLARHRQADMFLDTLPYCAHTTASDALWAGLPVLTCMGSTFAGRVAASLLRAVGLPELITSSPEEYERLAAQLAADAELLARIKLKLARNRGTHALFDTDRFRRHIEAAFVTIWVRHQRGQPPASFDVPSI